MIQVMQLLPNLLGALIVLFIGWIISLIVFTIVYKMLRWIGLDRVIRQSGAPGTVVQQADSKGGLSYILASLVKWLVILGAAGVAAEILNLMGVSAFIGTLIAYVPNILVAIAILVIGFVTAQKVSDFISESTRLSTISRENQRFLSMVAKYGIIIFAVMAALTQLNIVPRLIEIAFTGLVFALALAFGLGGRDHASQWIGKMKERTETR